MANTKKINRNKKFASPNPALIPTESLNQFSILERKFFPERYDENGARKPATVKNHSHIKKIEEQAEVSA